MSLANLGVITLFVADLATAKGFYLTVFEAPLVFETDDSAVFTFGEVMVNLLLVERAVDLLAPADPGAPDAGPRSVFTIHVENVDQEVARLAGLGVALLNGPMDRPWGVRTASFLDPAGYVWELAADIVAA